jgi:hypothetical protein
MDLALLSRVPALRGTRLIDDYSLYFSTLAEAEKALAVLHQVSRDFEFEINDPKTELIPLPERLDARAVGTTMERRSSES